MDRVSPMLISVVWLLLLLPVVFTYRLVRSPTSKIPGPSISKWTDAVLTYQWLRGRRCHYIHGLHQQYGPTVRIAPNEVDFTDVQSMKTIYSTRETFRKTEWYQNFTTIDKESVFNTPDVGVHRRLRKLLAAPISDANLRAYHDRIERLTRMMIDGMRGEMVSRGVVDVAKWFYFLAVDVLGDLTFGQPPGLLEGGEVSLFRYSFRPRHSMSNMPFSVSRMREKKKNGYPTYGYNQFLESAMWMAALRSAFPRLTAWSRIIPLPLLSRAKEATKTLAHLAEAGLARHKRLVDGGSPPQTVFTNLYRAQESKELSPTQVHNQAELYFIAGSDTTAGTLTFLIWAICRRPHIQTALVADLRTLPAEGFDDAQIRQLPYLDRLIQEGLRLYGAVQTSLPRYVPAGGADLGGYWFPEGTKVHGQAYSLHRDPGVFTNPGEFDPSRWEEPTQEMRDSFMPFGRGTRTCLGRHLAMIELRHSVAHFFLAFPDARVSTVGGMSDEDMEEQDYFVLSPKGKRCLIEAASATMASRRTTRSVSRAATMRATAVKKTTTLDIEDAVAPPLKRRKRVAPTTSELDAASSRRSDAQTAATAADATKPMLTTTTTTDANVTAPTGWESMYEAVRRMRAPGGVAHGAAVDTMGCERLADRQATAKEQRFHTLVALMLSSQTKDTVNAAAMHRLKTELPPCKPGAATGLTVDNVLAADPAVLNGLIRAVGFHNNKTKYLQQTAAVLREHWASDIPDTITGLTALPGVGPKMAYLCLSAAWDRTEGIGVDVHVHRITNLWGWHRTRSPEETRRALQSWLPRDRWREINGLLVGLGQVICRPVGRRCGECELGQQGLCKAAKG
ncbi:hypothetical protein L249_5130 [Ophiocordyceps polyrhachis-furcata BCC 54312]|uniref:Endonuclease III homolog n=1 Tax=Ophiocordyceps polyrhachis-furcata BCC 54312 TaxID=1330021 RepID=A0A367L3D8_9HYPO|nr:hypothetical protein L249_5130 [Ophiocordyceps polyrhachis-furcata BCC 54312]